MLAQRCYVGGFFFLFYFFLHVRACAYACVCVNSKFRLYISLPLESLNSTDSGPFFPRNCMIWFDALPIKPSNNWVHFIKDATVTSPTEKRCTIREIVGRNVLNKDWSSQLCHLLLARQSEILRTTLLVCIAENRQSILHLNADLVALLEHSLEHPLL